MSEQVIIRKDIFTFIAGLEYFEFLFSGLAIVDLELVAGLLVLIILP